MRSEERAERSYSQEQTCLTRKLWEVARDPAVLDLPTRRLFQLYLLDKHYWSPELTETMDGLEEQVHFLSSTFGEWLITRVLDHIHRQAEQLLEMVDPALSRKLELLEMDVRVQAFQAGELTAFEMINSIERFGELHFYPARVVIEASLDHADPDIRSAARWALVYWWRLPEYIKQLPDWLNDPDKGCRRSALELLSIRGTGRAQPPLLQQLARIADTEQEEAVVRLLAYFALCRLSGRPIAAKKRETMIDLVSQGADVFSIPGADWELVKRYR